MNGVVWVRLGMSLDYHDQIEKVKPFYTHRRGFVTIYDRRNDMLVCRSNIFRQIIVRFERTMTRGTRSMYTPPPHVAIASPSVLSWNPRFCDAARRWVFERRTFPRPNPSSIRFRRQTHAFRGCCIFRRQTRQTRRA